MLATKTRFLTRQIRFNSATSTAVPRVGKPAPAFKQDAMQNATEIVAFDKASADFAKLNCAVVGASVDSKFSHLAWVNTPRDQGGIGAIKIPLIADITKQMARDYGCLLEESGHTSRASYLIDPKGIVRHITINDPPVGRSVNEALRLVKAFQYADTHGEVCPANWEEGAATIKANPKDSKAFFKNFK